MQTHLSLFDQNRVHITISPIGSVARQWIAFLPMWVFASLPDREMLNLIDTMDPKSLLPWFLHNTHHPPLFHLLRLHFHHCIVYVYVQEWVIVYHAWIDSCVFPLDVE